MCYINSIFNNNYYGNPQSRPFSNCIELPDELLNDYIMVKGQADKITIEDNKVISIQVNQEIVNNYNQSILESLKQQRKEKFSNICHSTIINGIEIKLSDGNTYHFTLEETDQINLTTAYNAILQGAEQYPYHADGEMCKLYSAKDITTINKAAIKHKLYHTTYYNHLISWINRVETAEELESITYGIDLPEDLFKNMKEILSKID